MKGSFPISRWGTKLWPKLRLGHFPELGSPGWNITILWPGRAWRSRRVPKPEPGNQAEYQFFPPNMVILLAEPLSCRRPHHTFSWEVLSQTVLSPRAPQGVQLFQSLPSLRKTFPGPGCRRLKLMPQSLSRVTEALRSPAEKGRDRWIVPALFPSRQKNRTGTGCPRPGEENFLLPGWPKLAVGVWSGWIMTDASSPESPKAPAPKARCPKAARSRGGGRGWRQLGEQSQYHP